MAVNIGPKIGIDGEKEYRKQINDLITQAKTFSAEMRELESDFNDSGSAMDKNRRKSELLEKAIKKAVGNILETVTLFDVYQGKQIAEGKKSVAYAISMRSHEGTLTDEQADAAVKRVLKELSALGAELRA